MAHQAHNIPWNLLASNLQVSTGSCGCGVKNPRLRMKPNQGKELTHFVIAMIRNIDEDSTCERRKYPERYNPPNPTDIMLDDDCINKITPAVRQWRKDLEHWAAEGPFNTERYQCSIIPYEHRLASAFLQTREVTRCYTIHEFNGDGYFNVELVKTLLLYGEMDTILHACAHPDIGLKSWWSVERYDMNFDIGWSLLCEPALSAYICLNVVYCFPEMWHAASGKTKKTDYRHTKFYQRMLRTCTKLRRMSDIVTYPHRQFFGIRDNQFCSHSRDIKNSHWVRWAGKRDEFHNYPYGIVPIKEFLSLENEEYEENQDYQPHLCDISLVQQILCRQGLPLELVLEIMMFAKYEPKRRLKVPHDPLHSSNREELGKYLKYCWQILVRCDMLAKSVDMKIPWQDMISSCIIGFWGCRSCDSKEWFTSEYCSDHSWENDGFNHICYRFS